MNIKEEDFWRKKYSRGILYFIKNFDFQKDIPNRRNKTQQDFLGKTALLEFSERENVKIFITNDDLETNFEKIDSSKYLISIKKFTSFYESLKNKTNFDLAHAFFTNNLNVKNTYFSQDTYSEIFKSEGFQKFLESQGADNPTNAESDTRKNTKIDLSLISDLDILEELKNRNLNSVEFFKFAKNFLNSKNDIKIEELQNLTKTIDFKRIKDVLKIWKENQSNPKEVSFWQKFLSNNPWIISQVFAAPFAIFQNQFYVGGHHSGDLKGAKNTDFGYKHKYSQNVAIVEIKTPMTNLVDKTQYDGRSGIYPMCQALMGAISQVLNQKENLIKDFRHNNKEKNFEVWNPKAILIIGSEANEKLNEHQRACLELFKNSQKEIEIITFDDLFEKIKNLEEVFSARDQS